MLLTLRTVHCVARHLFYTVENGNHILHPQQYMFNRMLFPCRAAKLSLFNVTVLTRRMLLLPRKQHMRHIVYYHLFDAFKLAINSAVLALLTLTLIITGAVLACLHCQL